MTITINSQGNPYNLASTTAIQNSLVLKNLVERQDAMSFFRDLILRQIQHYRS